MSFVPIITLFIFLRDCERTRKKDICTQSLKIIVGECTESSETLKFLKMLWFLFQLANWEKNCFGPQTEKNSWINWWKHRMNWLFDKLYESWVTVHICLSSGTKILLKMVYNNLETINSPDGIITISVNKRKLLLTSIFPMQPWPFLLLS